MRFVLDNSVTMRWLFGDGSENDRAYAQHVLARVEFNNVLVPAIWGLEVANVIVKAEAKYGLSEARSTEFIHALAQMHIRVDTRSHMFALNDTVQLARRYHLSSYDASYLELALREGISLATLDEKLLNAADKAGVNVV